MTVVRTGIDIIECARFERLLNKGSFLSGIYTENELSYIHSKGRLKEQSAAGIFCAKEAFLKAFGMGIFSIRLNEIEIGHDGQGRPYIKFTDNLKDRFREYTLALSISHCRDYAVASVVAVSEKNRTDGEL